ncbi:MAG TPA: aldehyde dehydrogenase family protein [Acidimicrobiia bacterium]|jgi:acyl-CoA reductase-like NAD-dependent aldehyde dehydrogenase|nr:aldehyde dehydrogenase family protein [Acidimicrobiia bacterium]
MSVTTDERLLIGGDWVAGGDGGYDIVNPATEDVVGVAPEASAQQAHDAARAARDAFASWSQTTPQQRAELLKAAANRVRERIEDLVPLVIAETGCTATVGRSMQVPVAASRFDRYALGALEPSVIPLPPQEMPSTPLAPGGLMGALARRAPVGVVACVTPYNFPIVNMAGKIGPALAMGNTVIVRPAPQDPLAVIELVRILEEVGFPPGVVNVVTGSSPATGEALVESPDVDMISFTGSTSVGLRIAETGGRTMKRLLLELGGKGACLVLDDADLNGAVTAVGSVWTFHSGQICTAPTRAIVHRSRYQEFVERLSKMATVLPIGDPLDAKTVVGPLITGAHRERVEGYIRAGADEGAEVVAGGGRPAHLERGFYVEPTLLAEVRSDMRVAREEIFGPVIVVETFDDDEEAITLANNSDFGLYDYVFTGDSARGMRTARHLRAGNVGINTIQRNHETPFGGTKYSGVGRDGGSFGLHAYSELQSVVWPG